MSAYDELMQKQAAFTATPGYMEKQAFPAIIGWGARLLPRLLPRLLGAGRTAVGMAGRAVGRIRGGINSAAAVAKRHPFVSGMVGQQVLSDIADDGAQPQQQPQANPVGTGLDPTTSPLPAANLDEILRNWQPHYGPGWQDGARPGYRPLSLDRPFGNTGNDWKDKYGIGLPFAWGGVNREQPGYSPFSMGSGTYINGKRYTGGIMGGDDPFSA